MPLVWIDHEDFLLHDTRPGHPERPDRLRAIRTALDQSGLASRMTKLRPTPLEMSELSALHSRAYLDRCRRVCEEDAPTTMDSEDVVVCRESFDLALLAAGAAVHGADAIAEGKFRRAFSTQRPPGHHAERDHAMGFCLFNNIALAANRVTTQHRLDRVAIVDFDVHHGNGTQHLFEQRSDVLFISIHQDPRTCYPGTGHADELGKGEGEDFTLNVPMPPGSDDDDYRRAFETSILPKLDAYRPRMLFISAGFDAMAEDPLAQIELTSGAYDWMTRRLVEIAQQHCGGRILSVLEGGYDLHALGRAAAAHAAALAED